MKWFAWTVQNPHKQAEVAVILTGKKGAGKSFIFTQFVQIFGQHGWAITDKSRFAGQFSSHLRSMSFLFADEVYHPKEKEVEGRIKAMITQDSLDTEAKNLNPVQSKNRLHICMSTNYDHVISAGNDERRFYINKVSDVYTRGVSTQIEIKKYFTRLWDEMNNGGRAAMLHDLLNYNLKDFHPRSYIPQTEELARQKIISLTPLHHAFRYFLEEGVFPGVLHNSDYRIGAAEFYELLDRIEPICKNFSMNRKSDIMKQLGAQNKRWGPGKQWFLPPLKECRANWDNEFGKIEWDDLSEWTVTKSPY